MIWTKEKVWELQEMYSNPEYSVKEMAEYFGVSIIAIRNVVAKNFMNRGKYKNLGLKMCSKCKELLPNNTKYFHKNKSWRDGLHNQCKECRRKNKKECNENV